MSVTVTTKPVLVGPLPITVKNTGHVKATLGGSKYVVAGEGQELAPGAETTVSEGLSPDLWAVTKTGSTTLDVS